MTPLRSPSRIGWIAPLAFALALGPAAASAQTARTGTTPASKTAAAPAQRQPARAMAPSADAALIGRFEFEGGLGLAIPFESGVNTGFKLGAGAFYGLQTLRPGLVLQVGGTVGWTYNGYPSPLDGSLNTIDLLPTARLRYAVDHKLFVYGDGGLGLGILHSSFTIPLPGFPAVSSTDAALLIKLGGGIGYELQPRLSLVFEPAFNIYVKSGSITQFTMMAAAIYRP
jgi:Outer membrane protein beta-barrel domain